MGRAGFALLLVEWASARLLPYVNPSPPAVAGNFLTGYQQVSLSLGIILFGLVGAAVGRLLATREERPNP